MSDTNIKAVIAHESFTDLIDEDWLEEALSDDGKRNILPFNSVM